MTKTTVERQTLIEAVNTLPDDALLELANFVEYLCYKTVQRQSIEPSSQNFLLAVAGLGSSGQSDISESDEDILKNELDPIHGWSSEPAEQP